MGLDVEFYVRGAEVPLHFLRNHWEFQDLFFSLNPEPAYEGYDDFLVDAALLYGVATGLARQMIAAGLSRSDVPDNVPEDFRSRRPEVAYAQCLPVYMRILEDLLVAEAKHGPLICAWSA